MLQSRSNVLAEAMICGLPVIATDCKTGPREILGDSEHGILLPDITTENSTAVVEELAASILMLLRPECGQQFGSRAALRALDFRQETLIQQWVEAL
jgi:glycosyltransferase involved in cell wall biosynthesis